MDYCLIITQNENSKYDNSPGLRCNFPNRYGRRILEGKKFIYYRAGEKVYFGCGVIGQISPDPVNPENSYCSILDYRSFKLPVPFKVNDVYLEPYKPGYFQNSARKVSHDIYQKILSYADLAEPTLDVINQIFIDKVDFLVMNENISLAQALEMSSISPPEKREVTATVYIRSEKVSAYAIYRAKNICECCQKPAPFLKKDNQYYLEVHHLTPLSEGGFDHIENTIAVCPNCHRYLHYGKDAFQERELLRKRIIDKNNKGC